MHHAPAVSYPVGRSAFRTLLPVALALLLALADAAWWFQAGMWTALTWGVCLLGLATGGAALLAGLRPQDGVLHWDGEGWRWQAEGQTSAGRPRVRLDWQSGMLLEFRPPAGTASWLWVERGGDPLAWAGLRRAVFAAPDDAPADPGVAAI